MAWQQHKRGFCIWKASTQSFLEYMNRERSAEENESYREADEFYNSVSSELLARANR